MAHKAGKRRKTGSRVDDKEKCVAFLKLSAVNMLRFHADSVDKHLWGVFYGDLTIIYDHVNETLHNETQHAMSCFINVYTQFHTTVSSYKADNFMLVNLNH